MTPFNLSLHDHLMTLGFTHERVENSFEDIGEAESGPELSGGPAYDVYQDAASFVYMSEHGESGTELRDLEMEEYVKSMGIECDSYTR